MSEKNYTVVEKRMGQLGLTSTELLIYATIYGFTQKENGKFTGHLSYFKEQFGISRAAATKAIAHLVELKLIEKKAANYGGRYSRCSTYTAAPTENYKLLDDTSTCIDSQHQLYQNDTSTCVDLQHQLYQYDTSTCVDLQHQLYQNDTSTCVDSQHQLYQNDTSITYITYKDNIKEYNIEDNTITHKGGNSECESDNSDGNDECYYESDNSQIELSLGGNNVDNTVNAEDNKKSTGSKKEDTKAGTKSKKAQNAEITAHFEKFWAAYPRHIDKAKALKAFTKINPDDELLERMLNTIGQAKKTRQWQTPQYIPYPTTWLNGSRWEDEIDPKDVDYDIAHPHSLYNPIDRAVLNGENPFAVEDFWGQG